MSCEKTSKALIAYLDGRAGEDERRAVEAHLKLCAACRERAEEYRRLWQAMEEVPAVEPSLGFDARLRQRIAAEPRPRMWSWLVPAPRFSFTVALLAGLAIWIAARPPRPVVIQNTAANSEEQFRMIKDLGVLENYDVLSNFDALSDLPSVQPVSNQDQEQPQQQNNPANPGSGSGKS